MDCRQITALKKNLNKYFHAVNTWGWGQNSHVRATAAKTTEHLLALEKLNSFIGHELSQTVAQFIRRRTEKVLIQKSEIKPVTLSNARLLALLPWLSWDWKPALQSPTLSLYPIHHIGNPALVDYPNIFKGNLHLQYSLAWQGVKIYGF